MGIEAEISKLEELKSLKAGKQGNEQKKEPPKDEGTKPSVKPPEPEGKKAVPEDDDDLTGVDPKSQKALKKMQERINELIAKNKALEDRQASKPEKEEPEVDTFEEEVASLRSDAVKLLAKKKELRKNLRKAMDDGDDDSKVEDIEEKIDEITLKISKLDREYDALNEKKERSAKEKQVNEVKKEWNESYQKGLKKFEKYIVKDGKVNFDAPLFKATMKLLDQNRKPAKYATPMHKFINPEYDNKNGIYQAMKDAFEMISDENSKLLSDDASRKKAIEDQPLSGGSPDVDVSSGGNESANRQKYLAKLKGDAEKHGMDSPFGLKYLQALKQGYQYKPR